MITVRNSQKTIAIKKAVVEATAQKILKILGYQNWDVGIWITTNKTIRKYNKQFRHKDKATDILSFPLYDIVPGVIFEPEVREERVLGDIIISAERVLADARELDVFFEERLQLLLVHGLCHLVGYDHETDAQYVEMSKVEAAVLAQLR